MRLISPGCRSAIQPRVKNVALTLCLSNSSRIRTALQKAGVLFSISDDDSQTRGRNLAFNAGTAAAYGLSKEEALAAITLNAAKIMGVADKTGSIEAGKDANIVVSDGDILDMRTSNVTDAFIQGRKIDLIDKHKLLNERFEQKYELKGKKGF